MANPVFTCMSPTNTGSPSNFVADPFLFIQVCLVICVQNFNLRHFDVLDPLFVLLHVFDDS